MAITGGGRSALTGSSPSKPPARPCRQSPATSLGTSTRGGSAPRRQAAAKAEAEMAEAAKFTVGRLVEQWHVDWLSTKRRGYATRTYRNVVQTFEKSTRYSRGRSDPGRREEGVGQAAKQRNPPGGRPQCRHRLRHGLPLGLERRHYHSESDRWTQAAGSTSERDRVLTSSEARRIYRRRLATCRTPQGISCGCSMLTGCRRGEIAKLRWDEIVTEADGYGDRDPARPAHENGHRPPRATVEGGARCDRGHQAAPSHRRKPFRVDQRRCIARSLTSIGRKRGSTRR